MPARRLGEDADPPTRRHADKPFLISKSNFPLNYVANEWPVLAK